MIEHVRPYLPRCGSDHLCRHRASPPDRIGKKEQLACQLRSPWGAVAVAARGYATVSSEEVRHTCTGGALRLCRNCCDLLVLHARDVQRFLERHPRIRRTFDGVAAERLCGGG